MKAFILVASLFVSSVVLANYEEFQVQMSSKELNSYKCKMKSSRGGMIVNSMRDIRAADLKTATAIGYYMFSSDPVFSDGEVICELRSLN
jgi:hypothetical protein